VDDIPIPDTLHGVIAARIDRLPGETRHVLQLASVIGRIFTYPVLSAIHSPLDPHLLAHLVALERAQLIRERARVPERAYAFKHVLTQEAAYAGLLRRERRASHRRVAEALERLYPGRIEEQLGLLAHHWEQAGEAGRAVETLRRAGEQAAGQHANAEAVAYLSRALDLTPEDDHAARYAPLLAREGAYDMLGAREAQAQDLVALERLAEIIDDNRRRAAAALRQAHYAARTQDYPAAVDAAQRAIHAARAAGDPASQAAGHRELGRALRYRGEDEEAQVQLERAVTLAREAGVPQVEADALHELGSMSNWRDYARCERYANEQLRICREMGNKWDEGRALRDLGFLYYHRGEWSRAKAYYEGSLRVCRETGNRRDEGWALHMLGYVHLSLGDHAGANARAEEALSLHRGTGDRLGEAWTLVLLGTVCVELGDGSGAREWLAEGARVGHDVVPWFEAQAIRTLGDLSARVEGNDDQAGAHYRQALRLFQERGSRVGECQARRGLAWVALRKRDRQEALSHVEWILGYVKAHATDSWMMPGFLRFHWTCYSVLRACDDPRAEEILDIAYRLLHERAEAVDDETLRRSYLENVPYHREIVAAWEALHPAG
jgi:tetratricopeptide (TPR) repeat protein